ncbi:MAG: 3-oxoacyl-ACP reductase [Solirubrobacteraceae bacterium]|nr:3-oxoacyl-ACP reductase [Solirubrobacteraceae bacterium]
MSDRYATLVRSPIGKRVADAAGLPQPLVLDRWSPGSPAITGPVLLTSGGAEGPLLDTISGIVSGAGAKLLGIPGDPAFTASSTLWTKDGEKPGSIIVDATGITDSEGLKALWNALHPTAKSVKSSGRIIVVGKDPATVADPSAHIAQRALEGFTRSLGKEIGKGRTVNLVLVQPGGEVALESTIRFFASARSAYVSGQVAIVGKPVGKSTAPANWDRPLEGKVALVTGAARGIGAAIAATLHRDGAQIIGLDIPPLADDLGVTLAPLGGQSITLDVTAADAPDELVKQIKELGGKVDIVVHNAGITQDRTLARMKPERWEKVLGVNLVAPQRLTDALLKAKLLGDGSRIIGLASIAGIAGNNGQTNYGASKAGMIGFIEAYGAALEKVGGTANAVAPGFIETQMTAAIPFTIREAGRRMNSVSQGGLPVDVAETIAWFASPGSAGVNGTTVRVCGQSLLGA